MHGEPLRGVGRATEGVTTGNVTVQSAHEVEVPSPVPADFATRFARMGPESFVSWGHAAGRYTGTVYVTPEAKDSIARARDDLAAGTDLVMVSVDHTTHKPGPTFFMRKDARPGIDGGAGSGNGTWRYGVVEITHAATEDIALCARCHAEAPHDHVYALPE